MTTTWYPVRFVWAVVVSSFWGVSYWVRPYDMLADRRRWFWQPAERCGGVIVLPDAIDCSGCRCCPAGACEPGEPLGPGVCGHTCSCHPDFWREMYDEHFPGEPA